MSEEEEVAMTIQDAILKLVDSTNDIIEALNEMDGRIQVLEELNNIEHVSVH